MTYLARATLITGTPGIFLSFHRQYSITRSSLGISEISETHLIRLFRSRSLVATIYIRCFITRSTMQSSAYVPVWSHLSLSNRGSFAIRKASRYFGPNFSNSANTQSVIIGIHFANRQSIILGITSSLCWTVWDRKFVSTKIE